MKDLKPVSIQSRKHENVDFPIAHKRHTSYSLGLV